MRDYVRGLVKAAGENPVAGGLGLLAIVLTLLGSIEYRYAGVSAVIIECFALLLLAAVLFTTTGQPSGPLARAFLGAGANLPVLAFLAVVWLRVPGTPAPGAAVQEAVRFSAAAAAYFVASYRVRRTAHLGLLRDALLAGLWVVSVASLVGAMTGDADTHGPFGRPELLASAVTVMAAFAVGQAIHAELPGQRMAAGLGLLLASASLMLASEPTACYAGAAGAAAVGLLTMYATTRSARSVSRSGERQRAFIALVLAALVVILARPVLESTPTVSATSVAREEEQRADARSVAVRAVTAHPVVGSGTGMFPYVHHPRTSGGPAPGASRPTVSDQANSLWLQTAADTGVVGAGLLALAVAFVVAGAVRRTPRMDTGIRQNMLISAAGAVVAGAVDAALSPSWQFARHIVLLFLFLGLGAGMMRPHARVSQAQARKRGPLALAAATICLLLIPAAVATIRYAPTVERPGAAAANGEAGGAGAEDEAPESTEPDAGP